MTREPMESMQPGAPIVTAEMTPLPPKWEGADYLKRELARVERERARLNGERDDARGELQLKNAELSSARQELAELRAQQWIVARDGGRYCERCEAEIRRGEAYEVQDGTGGLVLHIHCPTKPGASMTPEEHYQHGTDLLALAEAHPSDDPAGAQTLVAIANGHFAAAALRTTMQALEAAERIDD